MQSVFVLECNPPGIYLEWYVKDFVGFLCLLT